MKRKQSERFISILFSVLGLAIIVGGIFLQIANNAFLKSAKETSATITAIETSRDSDGDTNHTVYVEFSVGDKYYSGALGEWQSGMHTGDSAKVYYNPDNPNEFQGGSAGFIGYILVAFGLIFFFVGAGMIYFKALRQNKNKKLLEKGIRLDAEINSVAINQSYAVNGRHPYVLDCTYVDPATHKMFSFRSENLWFDPEPIMRSLGITTATVYMDPNDSNRYYVNLEGLKNYLGN